jgi:hypothetical protein
MSVMPTSPASANPPSFVVPPGRRGNRPPSEKGLPASAAARLSANAFAGVWSGIPPTETEAFELKICFSCGKKTIRPPSWAVSMRPLTSTGPRLIQALVKSSARSTNSALPSLPLSTSARVGTLPMSSSGLRLPSSAAGI